MAEFSGGVGPQLNVHKTLFVGNLSYFCIDANLMDLFAPYGLVESIEIKRGKETGDCLMHGFVEMGSLEAAEAAAMELNGRKFMGRRIRVIRGSGKSPDAEKETWIQLHINFTSRQLDMVVTEEVLEEAFNCCGEPTDCAVKRHRVTQEPPHQAGYGFVYFADPEVAVRTLQQMLQANYRGVDYECSMSYKSQQIIANMARTMRAPGTLTTTGFMSQSPAVNMPPPSAGLMSMSFPDLRQQPSPQSSYVQTNQSPTTIYPPMYPQSSPYPTSTTNVNPNNMIYDPNRTLSASPQYVASQQGMLPQYPPPNPAFNAYMNHPAAMTMHHPPHLQSYPAASNTFALYPPPPPHQAVASSSVASPSPYAPTPNTVAAYSPSHPPSLPFYHHSVATPPTQSSDNTTLSSMYPPPPPLLANNNNPNTNNPAVYASPRLLAIQSYRNVDSAMYHHHHQQQQPPPQQQYHQQYHPPQHQHQQHYPNHHNNTATATSGRAQQQQQQHHRPQQHHYQQQQHQQQHHHHHQQQQPQVRHQQKSPPPLSPPPSSSNITAPLAPSSSTTTSAAAVNASSHQTPPPSSL